MRSRLVLLFLMCSAVFGQTPESPTFEVASVKPAAPPEANGRRMIFMRGGPGTPDPERVTFTGMPMMNLLTTAYDVKNFQITGPAWLDSERFDISAKIAPGATKEQFHLMLQNLLMERFHLVLHRESKQLPGYELVIAKSGLKLKESTEVIDTSAPPGPPPGPPGPPKRDANGNPILERPGLMMMMNMSEKAGPWPIWLGVRSPFPPCCRC